MDLASMRRTDPDQSWPLSREMVYPLARLSEHLTDPRNTRRAPSLRRRCREH
jgi:hypothetical protein